MKNSSRCIRRPDIGGWLITGLLVLTLILFAANARRYMQIFLDGTTLWLVCVFSSSLFFLFLTALLNATGSIERLSVLFSPLARFLFALPGESGYCLLLSFLCGYPIGAKTVADLTERGRLSRTERTKISIIASSSSPLFLLGSVGCGMFSSFKIGVILLLSHLLAVVIPGMGMRFFGKTNLSPIETPPVLPRKRENILYESMYSSVLSVAVVGGFVAVFYTLSFLLSDWHILDPLIRILCFTGMPPSYADGFARGLVEMTGGCGVLARSTTPLSVSLAASLITFGGVSVIAQQLCYLKKAEINIPLFLLGKVIQSVSAFLLCYVLCLLLGCQ